MIPIVLGGDTPARASPVGAAPRRLAGDNMSRHAAASASPPPIDEEDDEAEDFTICEAGLGRDACLRSGVTQCLEQSCMKFLCETHINEHDCNVPSLLEEGRDDDENTQEERPTSSSQGHLARSRPTACVVSSSHASSATALVGAPARNRPLGGRPRESRQVGLPLYF